MEIKYAVYPGFVFSATDGDLHYISARPLMLLYQVDPAARIVINELRSPRNRQEQLEIEGLLRRVNEEGLIVLRPKASGNYTLPAAK